MSKQIPFIKLFKTTDCFYFFDVNSNSIVHVNEGTYHELERYLEIEEETEFSAAIKRLFDRGYLKPNNSDIEIRHSAIDTVDEYMEGNVRQLILQVTQNCNLRCKYCVYSGSYVNRMHTKKRMSFETAKKAVDFYYEHNKYKDAGVISFYGGEPLLEMDLMKKVVDYCENLYIGKELQFNLTTNATLLNDDIVTFLEQHNFNVTISLDGPEEVQNQSRVFADNETGTFQCVINNINNAITKHPDFEENISFNAVLDTENDFKCSSDFFTYEFMKNTVVGATTLNENGNINEISYNEKFDINYRYELFKCYLKYIGKLDNQYVSKIINDQVASLKTDIHDKISSPYHRGKTCHPSGPCIAGATRLFVTVDGVFYPCERVNETCEAYIIGNLESGFDISRIKQLLNIGELTEQQCKNCWAIEYCNSCASGIDEGNSLCADKRLARCNEIKKGCELRMIEYCTLREMGCRFE